MAVRRTTRTADVRNEECVLAKTAVHSALLRSKGWNLYFSRSALALCNGLGPHVACPFSQRSDHREQLLSVPSEAIT
jgi:hypothetical protein